MPNRFIGDSIRLMYDVLCHGNSSGVPGIIMLIDFEKAFDSISWQFLEKCLIYFRFGQNIRQWIKVLYNETKARVQVNNLYSDWFAIGRGCRQGDPISPYLFLLCAEVLALMVKQNENIHGYRIKNQEIKLSQYADDTSLFLDGSRQSFQYCVHTILEYAKYSGLTMNFEKTKVIRFGPQQGNAEEFLPEMKFHWNPTSFTLLGIDFTTDLLNITDVNIDKKIESIQKEISHWNKRNLTPFGKIVVIKSLLVSKIVHILTSLPNPSEDKMIKIQKMFNEFLWNNKPDKISRKTAKQPRGFGGLGMIDLNLFSQALKVSWYKRLLQPNKMKWKELTFALYPSFTKINDRGSTYTSKLAQQSENPFWKEVLTSCVSYFDSFKASTFEDFLSMSFLFNPSIKIGRKPIDHKMLIERGIFFIHQLTINNKLMSYEQFTDKYDIRVNYLSFHSIISAIKSFYKSLHINEEEPTSIPRHQFFLNSIYEKCKGCSKFYHQMLSSHSTPKGIGKWQTRFATFKAWIPAFYQIRNTTKDTQLHWFQYRILHHILSTNRSVSKFNKDQSDLCSFCSDHSETIYHLLWSCHISNAFWKTLERILVSKCDHISNLTLNDELIILGISNSFKTDMVFDLIISLAKFHICKCKVNKIRPSLTLFLPSLKVRYEIEKSISHDKLKQIETAWLPYINLIQ